MHEWTTNDLMLMLRQSFEDEARIAELLGIWGFRKEEVELHRLFDEKRSKLLERHLGFEVDAISRK